MMKVEITVDGDDSLRDVIDAGSTNGERALLLAQLEVVKRFVVDSLSDDWQTVEDLDDEEEEDK